MGSTTDVTSRSSDSSLARTAALGRITRISVHGSPFAARGMLGNSAHRHVLHGGDALDGGASTASQELAGVPSTAVLGGSHPGRGISRKERHLHLTHMLLKLLVPLTADGDGWSFTGGEVHDCGKQSTDEKQGSLPLLLT